MSAYLDYYIPEVEAFYGEKLNDETRKYVMELYKLGWHPRRVAKHLEQKKHGLEGSADEFLYYLENHRPGKNEYIVRETVCGEMREYSVFADGYRWVGKKKVKFYFDWDDPFERVDIESVSLLIDG